jgi:hypothetical protein
LECEPKRKAYSGKRCEGEKRGIRDKYRVKSVTPPEKLHSSKKN